MQRPYEYLSNKTECKRKFVSRIILLKNTYYENNGRIKYTIYFLVFYIFYKERFNIADDIL